MASFCCRVLAWRGAAINRYLSFNQGEELTENAKGVTA